MEQQDREDRREVVKFLAGVRFLLVAGYNPFEFMTPEQGAALIDLVWEEESVEVSS